MSMIFRTEVKPGRTPSGGIDVSFYRDKEKEVLTMSADVAINLADQILKLCQRTLILSGEDEVYD